jgi:hypothetical protein
MIELSDKRELYSITNSGETLKISGRITAEGDTRISEFTGQFADLEGTWLGNFYYAESTEGKINQNVSEIAADYIAAASELLLSTVSEFKNRTE